ncbi:hypothetical protein LCGC14_0580720 [marine sediment metagenome]|uniref:Uncharacterized protein n=1 Tax=marine sediment metagenome TaxID=412755 RepID=A0A0F9RGG6_9ZZZZ
MKNARIEECPEYKNTGYGIVGIQKEKEKCPDSCCYGTSRENCTLGKEAASECKSPS